jgi:WXG100 family type VII secretion target
MAEQIEVNYEAMSTIRTQFADKANQIEQLKQGLESHIDALRSGGWIGQGANSFYTEMDQILLPALDRLNQALLEAENTVQSIVTEFEVAEDEAKSYVEFNFD